MKKLILTALIGAASFGIANADGGACWVGTATLTWIKDNHYILTCPESNHTCFETDHDGPLKSGDHIQVHFEEATLDAVVESAVVPEETIPGDPPSYYTSQPIPVTLPSD